MTNKEYMRALRGDISRAMLDPAFRESLAARNADGEAPIIPARVEDTVAETFAHVDQFGGAGNVVLRWEGDLFVLCVGSQPPAESGPAVPRQDVGDESNLGMVLALMAEAGISEMRVKVVASLPHWVSRSRVPVAAA